jgi:hypothetical protein
MLHLPTSLCFEEEYVSINAIESPVFIYLLFRSQILMARLLRTATKTWDRWEGTVMEGVCMAAE